MMVISIVMHKLPGMDFVFWQRQWAMEKDLPYEIKCPSLLICGTKDHAGSCIRYNREWHRKTKIPLKWIEGAGHNSNTDKPDMINSLLEEFFSNIL